MPLDVMILDLDGTLVDSNALHVEAWRRALERYGYRIAPDRIWLEIGKGGDQLVPSLLGHEADAQHGDALRKAQPEELEPLARRQGVRAFDGAERLIDELRRRSVRTCLATSSNRTQLRLIEETSGVEWSRRVDATVNADDARRSKPFPDLVHAAVKTMNVSPAQCAMLGDTIYDAEAATAAGVIAAGLETGRNPRDRLLSAGARAVFRDVRDFVDHLDDALHRLAPLTIRLTYDVLRDLMRPALDAAEEGLQNGEAPIGCALFRGDGSPVAAGYNQMNARQDKTAHAEIVTFARSAGKVDLQAKDLVLVSTLEPCVMCTGAAMVAAVDTIVYGLKAPADSGTARVRPPTSPESQMPRIVGDVLADESRRLLEHWYTQHEDEPQARYVGQLLQLTRSAPLTSPSPPRPAHLP
jgi:HAD superfamily hydrolase (TIGR01509 family)